MKILHSTCACLALAALPALSAIPLISPVGPTTNDTIVLEVPAPPSCAQIIPGTVEMVPPNTIRVRYETAANTVCSPPLPQPSRIAIGRLPSGEYVIQLIGVVEGVPVGTGVFTVSNPPATGDRGPLDDFSGHYVSDGTFEGVFVTQFGRTAFISYLSYAADGKPEWHIISDARWDPATRSYSGGLMRVESGIPTGTGTGTGSLTTFQYVGQARFTPTGQFDHARFEGNIFSRPVNRALTRYRF
jgi:hypothetical protein